MMDSPVTDKGCDGDYSETAEDGNSFGNLHVKLESSEVSI
jgi:hypothetical protein